MDQRALISSSADAGATNTVRAGSPRRSQTLAVVASLVTLALGAWLGRTTAPGAGEVKVLKVFPATVSFVSATHDAGCVQPDSGGTAICSDFAVIAGTRADVGSKVRVAHVTYPRGGTVADALLLFGTS